MFSGHAHFVEEERVATVGPFNGHVKRKVAMHGRERRLSLGSWAVGLVQLVEAISVGPSKGWALNWAAIWTELGLQKSENRPTFGLKTKMG